LLTNGFERPKLVVEVGITTPLFFLIIFYCSGNFFYMGRKSRPLKDRFWEKVHKTETCWLWTGSKRGGESGSVYGSIMLKYEKGKHNDEFTHRVSYILEHGVIPKGMHVLHTCDNPLCVRPDHLRVGTHQDNMNDKKAKGRENLETTAKDFSFRNSKGKIITGRNLAKFCRENRLHRGYMTKVHLGKKKSHKGYIRVT